MNVDANAANLPSILRVAETIMELTQCAELARSEAGPAARRVLANLEAAFDNAFVTWCMVQGETWLSAAIALHWKIRCEGATLREFHANADANEDADEDALHDAHMVMIEAVSQTAVTFLTLAVSAVCACERVSANVLARAALQHHRETRT
jgi:hypothetical protein